MCGCICKEVTLCRASTCLTLLLVPALQAQGTVARWLDSPAFRLVASAGASSVSVAAAFSVSSAVASSVSSAAAAF